MMRHLNSAALVLLFGGAALSSAPAVTRASDPAALTVHEWGTFTSIAGADGKAVEWLPQTAPTDLPCFVERNRFNVKGGLSGTVRMETPVLYFYAPRETVVNVAVRFRSGVITEWFPRAVVTPANAPALTDSQTIAWRNVKIVPGAAEDFPVEIGSSHYYAARRTAAAPLMSGSEREKFLFYRGVGRFLPAIVATVDAAGNVAVDPPSRRRRYGEAGTPGDQPIDDIILFSNDRGRIAYQVRHTTDDQVSVEPEVVGQEPTSELERLLLEHGLYPDEARAMLDTWRDSWFEDGTRLIYIVPRSEIETILPLQITPTPTDVVRLFVGRMELITPAIEKAVRDALLADDIATLRAYGRFLQVIGRRIVAASAPGDRNLLQRRLQDAYAAWATPQDRCSN
jgi:hypothetical protein